MVNWMFGDDMVFLAKPGGVDRLENDGSFRTTRLDLTQLLPNQCVSDPFAVFECLSHRLYSRCGVCAEEA